MLTLNCIKILVGSTLVALALSAHGARLTVEDLSTEVTESDIKEASQAVRELIDTELKKISDAKEPLQAVKTTTSSAVEKTSTLADRTLLIAAIALREESFQRVLDHCKFFYMSATLTNIQESLELLLSCSDRFCEMDEVSYAHRIVRNLIDELDDTLAPCEAEIGR